MRKRLGSQLASADVHNYRILLNMRYVFFRSGRGLRVTCFWGLLSNTMAFGVCIVQRVWGLQGLGSLGFSVEGLGVTVQVWGLECLGQLRRECVPWQICFHGFEGMLLVSDIPMVPGCVPPEHCIVSCILCILMCVCVTAINSKLETSKTQPGIIGVE